MARRYRATVREFADAAVSERLEDDFATRPDAELAVRARLLHDRLAEGWTLSQLGVLVAHVAGRPLRRRAKADVAALGRGTNIAHEPTFPVVLGLAELLRADEELRALAEWGDPDAVRQKSPEFGAAFDEALTRIGHRGPNEAELSGSPFAERPELVFAAALRASRRPVRAEAAPTAEQPTTPADEPPTWPADDGPSTDDPPAESSTSDQSAVDSAATPPRRKRKFAEKLAIAGQRHRELAIDATVRYTGELRRLVREWGRRQVHAGRLVDVDDAFFLTLDELLSLPADALTRVERRRADWSRLSEVRMPAVVGGSWRPEVVDYPTPEGKQLHGVGVVAGVAAGPVRLLTDARANVEPGDVVVVRVVDAGYAALLGPAAAIVTDLGGPLSRAAIVARELGVPCVTGTRDASARLAPGTMVRVDGASGDVTVLSPASVRA
jgi:phosphohistidine swiveling domain-containing protein